MRNYIFTWWLFFSSITFAQLPEPYTDSAVGGENYDGEYIMGLNEYDLLYGCIKGRYTPDIYFNNYPMRKYLFLVNVLPKLTGQLSLEESQVEKLIEIKLEYQEIRVKAEALLAKDQNKLNEILMDNDYPENVRDILFNSCKLKADIQVAAYDAFLQMLDVLYNYQKQELNQLFPDYMRMREYMDY